MNKKLKELYASKWENYGNEIHKVWINDSYETKPANPLLIKVDEQYEDADIKIVVFGQETNGWYDELNENEDEILQLQNAYYDFVYNQSYGGAFWNGLNRFKDMLRSKFPNKNVEVVWNNVVKIGKNDGMGCPPDYIYEVEKNTFNVVKEELKILKPDVVLFLSGPYYDGKINDIFGEIKYSSLPNYSERQLAKLDINGIDFTFRAYHPNYLFRNDIDDYFETIINEIRF